MKKLIKMYKGSSKGLPVLSNYGSLYGVFKKVLFEGFNESNILEATKNDNILTIKLDTNTAIMKYPIDDVLISSFFDYELLVIDHVDNDTVVCECMSYGESINIPTDLTNAKIKNAPLGFKLRFFDDNQFKLVYTTDQTGGLDYCLYDTYFGDTGGENGGAPTKRAVIFCSTGMTDVDNNPDDTHFPQTTDGSNAYKASHNGVPASSYKRNGISNIVYGAGVDYTFIGNGNFFYFIVKNKLYITTDKTDMVDKDIVHGFGKVKSFLETNKNTNLFISAPSSIIDSNYGDCAVNQQHRNAEGYASFNSFIQPRKSNLKYPTLLNDVSSVFYSNIFTNYSTIGEFAINYESGCSYSGGGLNLNILYNNLNSYSITRALICKTDANMTSYEKIAYMPFMYYFTIKYSDTPNQPFLENNGRKFYKIETKNFSLGGNQYDSRFLIEITPKGYNNYD